ncbi:hypothetical protein [Streptomyces ardesiacus]|uniref:hypothetical protein n=1 Tax=Streptomyces ardesiacus TaxID=285564 RepID=UPI003F4A3C14
MAAYRVGHDESVLRRHQHQGQRHDRREGLLRATGKCNGFKTAYARSWIEAATNVLDGTQYRLLFSSYSAGLASA